MRTEGESDWIFFYLPIGSLASVYPMGAFPIADGGDLAWRFSLDEWLCTIGQRAFEAAQFRLGLIGFDGGDFSDAAEFAASGVPDERWIGYLVPDTSGLKWFPPNRGAPIEFAVSALNKKVCDECGSTYNAATSAMAALCPECAHWLYGYPSCEHVFEDSATGKRCTRCAWDGSRSKYIRTLIDRNEQ